MRAASLCLVALALLLGAGAVRAGEEPEFDGKPASWWGNQLGGVDSDVASARVRVALARGGAKAVPVLVALLRQQVELKKGGSFLQFVVESILSGMAIHDSAAAPALIEGLVPCTIDQTDGWHAKRVLMELLIAHPEQRGELRTRIIEALRTTPPRSSTSRAEEMLAGVADDSDACLRVLIRLQLKGTIARGIEEHLLKHDEKVILLVRAMLERADEKQALRCARLLDLTFDLPFGVVADLTRLSRDPAANLSGPTREVLIVWCRRPSTTFTLRKRAFLVLRGDPPARIIVLSEMKKDAVTVAEFAGFAARMLAEDTLDPRVRVTLTGLVGELPLDRRETLLPHLIAGLTNADSGVRRMSAEVIGSLGTAAKAAIPALERAAGSDDARLARAARQALAKIRPE